MEETLKARLWQAANFAGARDSRRSRETPHRTDIRALCQAALQARTEICPNTPLDSFAKEAARILRARGIAITAADILAAADSAPKKTGVRRRRAT